MRTSAPSASSLAPGERTVRGVLDSQRPTVAVAGKNRARVSSRSLHPSSASRCCSANSVRPSARRCAVMRTSASWPVPEAVMAVTPSTAINPATARTARRARIT